MKAKESEIVKRQKAAIDNIAAIAHRMLFSHGEYPIGIISIDKMDIPSVTWIAPMGAEDRKEILSTLIDCVGRNEREDTIVKTDVGGN